MKRNSLILLMLSLFLLLGIFLGTSITTFILFLNKSDNLLAIISYLCLGLFTLLAVALMFTLVRFSKIIFSKGKYEGKENEKE